MKWLQWILGLVIALCAGVFVVSTIHWPLVGDISLIHYVCFLVDHGMAPYREIADINMPGAYFVDWTVMHLLGSGGVAARIFDFSLLALAGAAMIVIARPYGWFAGLYASAMLLAVHARDGLEQTGQRDLTVAVLLLAAVAFLFEAQRRRMGRLGFFFGIAAGFACTIKPTAAPLSVFALAVAVFIAYRKGYAFRALAASGIAGFCVPLLTALIFLWRENALPAFLYTLRSILPLHVSMGQLPARTLLLHIVPSILQPLAALALVLIVANKFWRNWEFLTLLAGIFFGMVSFYVQKKGLPYHYYPEEAFLLLACGIIFVSASRGKGKFQLVGLAGLLLGVLWFLPQSTVKAAHYDWRQQEYFTTMQADLERLGGPTLSGNVQCMDLYSGCLNVLYNAKLIQSTGILYDCYMLQPDARGVALELRHRFMSEIEQHPPAVLIVTNQVCFNQPDSFDKFSQWPEFEHYLAAHYTQYVERPSFPAVRWWTHPVPMYGYRIYKLASTQ